MKKITFLHTADLHLDSPFRGMSDLPKELFQIVQESTFTAFSKVIDAALEHKVDFVLIAGDLFDGEDRSIKAQARLRKQLKRLGEEEIPCYIIHGNHDHLSGSWLQMDMPANVHVFDEKVSCQSFVTKMGIHVHIYGFSYPERHVLDRKVHEYEKIAGADFHVAMLHGQCEGEGTDHAPYAPFSIGELLSREMDYWALGHIHQRKILYDEPPIVYPGNIQGRHRKEIGEKGCYVVELSEWSSPTLEFLNVSSIQWEEVDVSLTDQMNIGDVYSASMQELEQIKLLPDQHAFVSIKFTDAWRLADDLRLKLENGEFLELLQDDQDFHGSFKWPYKVKVNGDHPGMKKERIGTFVGMLDETIEKMEMEGMMSEAVEGLFSHMHASRLIDPIQAEEWEQLQKEARQLIVAKLSERMK